MANILQVPVPTRNAGLAWSGRSSPGINTILFLNPDLNNTVWLGQDSTATPTSANVYPLAPNGSFSGDPTTSWYVIGAVAGISPLVVVPNGQASFLSLTQGLGKLVIPQVQSPNFVTGVSGWIIRKDGSAEFNNVTIRGGIIVSGTNLQYSGTPALGNLVASISSASGVDAFGNVYEKGVNAYITFSGVIYAIGLNQTGASNLPGISIEDTANPPFTPAGVFGIASNGTVKKAETILSSGQVTNADNAAIVEVISQTQSTVQNGTAQIKAGITSIGETVTVQVDDNLGTTTFTQNIATPANTGFPSAYADVIGNLATVSAADSQPYVVGTRVVQTTSTILVNTLPGSPIVLVAAPVGITSYEFEIMIVYLTAGAASTPRFAIAGTATLSQVVGQGWFTGSAAGSAGQLSQVFNGSLPPQNGPTMVAGGLFAYYAKGNISFSGAGNFTVFGSTNNVADTYQVAIGSYMKLTPTG